MSAIACTSYQGGASDKDTNDCAPDDHRTH